MGWEWWLAVCLGGLLSLLASTVVLIFQEPILAWFERHTNNRALKTLANENRHYQLALRLKSDAPYAVAIFALRLAMLQGWFILSVLACINIAILSMRKWTKGDDPLFLTPFDEVYSIIQIVAASAMLFFSMVMAFRRTTSMIRLRTSMGQFKKYRARLIARWPDQDWPETYQPD